MQEEGGLVGKGEDGFGRITRKEIKCWWQHWSDGNDHFLPRRFAVLKWYENVCACVCVCVDGMNLTYALHWLIHISVHSVLCQCYTQAHAHTHPQTIWGQRTDVAKSDTWLQTTSSSSFLFPYYCATPNSGIIFSTMQEVTQRKKKKSYKAYSPANLI